MNTFLHSNDAKWKMARTIVQGIIGVIIAYLDVILGLFSIPNEMRPLIVATVMAVLTPIMSCIKTQGKVIALAGGENDAVTEIEHELYEPDEEEDGDEDE